MDKLDKGIPSLKG